MKKALYTPSLVLLALLGACASQSQQPQPSADSASAAGATNTASAASTDSAWLAQRAKYMDCVQRRADEGVPGSTQSKAVVSSALAACEGELKTMHDAFRAYLDGQMVSSHGKSGARQAADRVTKDTREKARAYLVPYVDRQRYLAKSR